MKRSWSPIVISFMTLPELLRKEQEEFEKEFGYLRSDYTEWNKSSFDSIITWLSLHDKRILKGVGEMIDGLKKEQLDKNDPDNYGACYAIGGFNDALLKVNSLLQVGE